MYSRFMHSNGGFYAYIEAPVSMLALQAPEDANNAKKNIVYDEDGNEVSYELKTMTEYLTLPPLISIDGTKCICLLNETLEPRLNAESEEDIAFWDEKLSQYGLGSDTWMTIAEYKEHINNGDYDVSI